MFKPDNKVHLVLLTDRFADIQEESEKLILELAKGLNMNDFVVTVASLKSLNQDSRELVEKAGCKLELFPVKRIYGLFGFFQGIKFFNFLRSKKVRILQTCHFGPDIWGTIIGHLAGVGIIISNRQDVGCIRGSLHIRSYKWVNRWVTRIVVNSKSILDHIDQTERVPAENIELIYNGGDIPGTIRRYEQLYTSLLARKRRVMHFVSSGGLFGAENVLLNLAENMDNKIYHPIVAAIQDGRKANLQVAEKARGMRIPVKVFQSKGRIDFDTITKVRRCLVAHKIDILHTHNYKSDIIGCLAAKGLNVKLIATAHGYTDVSNRVSIYERIDRWFLKKFFDRVVVVSDSVLPNFTLHKKFVIPNGVNVDRFDRVTVPAEEIRKQYGLNSDDLAIGTVGRLSVEKNQKFLIEAAKKLCSSNSRIKFMIVGDGPKEEELKAMVRTLKLEKQVIFTGLIRNVAPFYKAFDIFTLPSLTEGVPMTVLEAMASKTPVVATRVGGIPQIIAHGQTGMLVGINDVDGLCSALEELLINPGMRSQMAEAAFQMVRQDYSIERMVNLYHQVYQEALSK